MMSGRLRKVIVVVKQTPFEQYRQLKQIGKAPLNIRWGRLENRYNIHQKCVSTVRDVLERHDLTYNVVGREDLCKQHIEDVELVIAVGGDGTVLSASHFLLNAGGPPLLGVNSDPTKSNEKGAQLKKTDERRSKGALCMLTATDVARYLPKILERHIHAMPRTRIQTVVKSTFTETKLPPALNDVLMAHPSPAAVSRFRLGFIDGTGVTEMEHFYFNVWSSGMWLSTATGSSAAMLSAGGEIQDVSSRELQYKIREHLLEEGTAEALEKEGHGLVNEDTKVHVRWNSLKGHLYVDGEHAVHHLKLGDEIDFSAKATPLWLYTRGYEGGPPPHLR